MTNIQEIKAKHPYNGEEQHPYECWFCKGNMTDKQCKTAIIHSYKEYQSPLNKIKIMIILPFQNKILKKDISVKYLIMLPWSTLTTNNYRIHITKKICY